MSCTGARGPAVVHGVMPPESDWPPDRSSAAASAIKRTKLHGRIIALVALACAALTILSARYRDANELQYQQSLLGHAHRSNTALLNPWAAADLPEYSSSDTPWTCGACVLDPLVYPDTYCSATPAAAFNGSTAVAPGPQQLEQLEPFRQQSTMLDVLAALPRRDAAIGVLGDSFMQQALDAAACELRRLGRPAAAGFMRWDVVLRAAGTFDEDRRPARYYWGGQKPATAEAATAVASTEPRWFVLSQMHYNANEVRKLLEASDVAIVNYGLHACQPARAGADARCVEAFRRHEAEMHELFATLQAHAASRPGAVAIFQETSSQHFPSTPGGAATGDWELRDFFPRLGPKPPGRCQCAPSDVDAVPLRTQLIRNLSVRYPRVRLLRLHDLLSPRYGWHQQDCKARARARAERRPWPPPGVDVGCDCTHYCHSPAFWRRYWSELAALLRRRV